MSGRVHRLAAPPEGGIVGKPTPYSRFLGVSIARWDPDKPTVLFATLMEDHRIGAIMSTPEGDVLGVCWLTKDEYKRFLENQLEWLGQQS